MRYTLPNEIPFFSDNLLNNIPKNPLIICSGSTASDPYGSFTSNFRRQRATEIPQFNIFLSILLYKKYRIKNIIVICPHKEKYPFYRDQLRFNGHKSIQIIPKHIDEHNNLHLV